MRSDLLLSLSVTTRRSEWHHVLILTAPADFITRSRCGVGFIPPVWCAYQSFAH